ncbi:MoaD/ThiS family protein [Amycolatopsis regifaucium]|uniref:Molybdopterin synthase sulfur carrier subunit n=1 Tax=Amycolatopsis regifaucium TaxID=546365 RepID=A0A154MT23_9PSEU|nr:MoaD/ThiS family protein [Amycolatopsis regifaucium]KZB87250.1 molybdopterin synthase sulfur carrier subunit [Amycolatopsis regifaucium]OKA08082.1 molybdopterin synthase sulfur carrier subunit [Amycolatopsis regifaucium]SFI38921.1 Molybdopterin converting factor, small subunit [Amycolatopsis regifaucium]
MVTIVVRYFASARAAVGIDEEKVTLPDGARVADAVTRLRELHPETLPKLLEAVSYLLDGVAVRDLTRPLTEGAELDVLPPFAGG